jgi:hypothetical protein
MIFSFYNLHGLILLFKGNQTLCGKKGIVSPSLFVVYPKYLSWALQCLAELIRAL